MKAYKQDLVESGPVVAEKNKFIFQYVNDLGPGQEITLTFNTHIHSLTQLVVCIYKLSGHGLQ